MDVCPRFSVLCCPVLVEALRQADPPSKESYQINLENLVLEDDDDDDDDDDD
jgi:hypothetical protein